MEQKTAMPTCRQKLIALGLPYPKSSCHKCGGILRPGWRCGEEAASVTGPEPAREVKRDATLPMTLDEAYVLHRHHEEMEKACAAKRAYGEAETHRKRAGEIGAAFDAWRREQPEDVQEMGLLEQIDLYAKESALAARGAGGVE